MGAYRRIVGVPVGKCPAVSGQVELIGLACMYLVQKVDIGNPYIVGQFMEKCELPGGTPGNQPATEGPYRIP